MTAAMIRLASVALMTTVIADPRRASHAPNAHGPLRQGRIDG